MDENNKEPIVVNSNMGLSYVMYFSSVFCLTVLIWKDGLNELTVKICLFFIVVNYVWFWFIANVYLFYEGHIEICYLTRIWIKKRKIIMYSDIEKIKYYGDNFPFVRIYQIGEHKKRIASPSNSFEVSNFKRTQKTLKFLQSKGIPIEIKSDWEKQQRILD